MRLKNIILIGFMGAGKTTLGRQLAKQLGVPFVDTDERIEQGQGRKISDMFDKEGEAYFRRLETEQLEELAAIKKRRVISVGGGLPVQEQNHALLKELGRTVYLKAEKETLIQRLSGDTSRPLLKGGGLEEKIDRLMSERGHIYEMVADVTVHTDHMGLLETVRAIRSALCI